jgi:hypothetical protein
LANHAGTVASLGVGVGKVHIALLA